MKLHILLFFVVFFNVSVISNCYQERIASLLPAVGEPAFRVLCLVLGSSGQESRTRKSRGHHVVTWLEDTVSRERSGELHLFSLEQWKVKGRSYSCLQLPTGTAWIDTVGGALWYDRRQRTWLTTGEALIGDQEKRFSQWEWPTTWIRGKRHCNITIPGGVQNINNVTLSSQIWL